MFTRLRELKPVAIDLDPEPTGLASEVLRLKTSLDASPATAVEEHLETLNALCKLGTLPTEILGETKIGLTVSRLAKEAADSDVRIRARNLVDLWKVSYRKRKADEVDACHRLAPTFYTQSASDDTSAGRNNLESVADSSKEPSALSLEHTNELEPLNSVVSREKVRDKILQALSKAEEIQAKDGDLGARNKFDSTVLAAEIEEALHIQLARQGKEADYRRQARCIIGNLKDPENPDFGFKVFTGRVKPAVLPKLSAEEMASDARKAAILKSRKEYAESRELDWDLRHGQVNISGTFTCGKCKSKKTTYYQMQTRKSDEPMTTFVQCLNCKNRWKFC